MKKTLSLLAKALSIILIAIACITPAYAHKHKDHHGHPKHHKHQTYHKRHKHHKGRGPKTRATIVIGSPAKSGVSFGLSIGDRRDMAIKYLRRNHSLSPHKYAAMTGLSIDLARAELDAFAVDMSIPIGLSIQGGSRFYILLR